MDNVVDLSTITSGRDLKQFYLATLAKSGLANPSAYYKGFAAALQDEKASRGQPLDYYSGYNAGRRLCRC